ncbi:Ig-like domain-containing protein [Mycolicibacterium vaccae]|uniref:Ig-like domain-containing protein n=1 Tax=Mycolicibacterium vaccae TaxID=1810 RepID=UPI003CEEBBA3
MGIGTAVAHPAWADPSDAASGSASRATGSETSQPRRASRDAHSASRSDTFKPSSPAVDLTGADPAATHSELLGPDDDDDVDQTDENELASLDVAAAVPSLADPADRPARVRRHAAPVSTSQSAATSAVGVADSGDSKLPDSASHDPDAAVDPSVTPVSPGRTSPADTAAVNTYTLDTDAPNTAVRPVQQPKTPIGVLLGGPIKLIDIAARAINMLFSPPPDLPADQPLLMGVLLFVRREIQRTFFNDSPHAVADIASTSQGIPTRITVLANDSDADADVLTVTGHTEAANGLVTLNADGSFTYTPLAGFAGTDTFTYTVADATSPWHVHSLASLFRGGHEAVATVTITVAPTIPVNRAPLAADDDASTKVNTPIQINVLANDADPDGDNLTLTALSTPAHGTVSFNGAIVTYTPAPDYHGGDTFTYTVTDNALSSTATVYVTVTTPDTENHAPIVGADAFNYTVDPSTGALTGTVNVVDPDGDTLTYTIGTTQNSALGSFVVDHSTGAWVFTPSTTALVAAYSNGGSLLAEFTIKVSDGTTSTPVTVSAPTSVSSDALASLLRRAGSRPSGVALGSDGTVYIVNSGANTLSVLKPGTSSIASTIRVGASPSSVNVGPDGRVWVTNGVDDTVTVVDASGTDVLATIDVGSAPTNLAFGVGGAVYITNAGDGTVSVINSITNLVDRTITLGGTPTGIASGPDGRIYVADFSGSAVTVIDPFHDDALTSIDVPGVNPYGVVVAPNGTVYVTAPVESALLVLTPTGDGYTSHIVPVGVTPTALALGDNGAIYVTDTDANTVTIVDSDTFATTTFAAGSHPNSVSVGADGRLYITNADSDSLSIIDVRDGLSTGVPIGVDPNTVSVDSQGNLSVVNNFDNTVSVVHRPATGTTLTGTVRTGTVTTGTTSSGTGTATGFDIPGSDQSQTVVSPDGRYAYVNHFDGTVSVINPATATATTFHIGGGGASYVRVSPDSRYAYAVDYSSGTVAVINPIAGTATVFHVGPGDGFDQINVVVSPDSRYAYATDYRLGGAVWIINPATGTATSFDLGNFSLPMFTTVSPDGRYAYVTSLSAIDARYSAVILNPVAGTATSVSISRSNTAVVVSSDGRFAFAPHYGGVSVIDPTTGTAITVAARDGNFNNAFDPTAMVISPDGRYVFVNNYDSVTIVSPATRSATNVATDAGIDKIVVSPDSRYAYVTTDESVLVINSATGSVTTVAAGVALGDVVVSPDSRYAYVTVDNSVLVIDPAARSATTVAAGVALGDVVVSPDSRYAYVMTSSGLAVINPITGTTRTITAARGSANVVVSPDSRNAYITTTNGVVMVNPGNGAWKTIATGEYPANLVVSPNSRYAYVTSYSSGRVTVINSATGTAATIFADHPQDVAVSFDSRYAYVAAAGSIMVIDAEKLAYPEGIAPDYWTSTAPDKPVVVYPVPSRAGADPTEVTITGFSQPANGTVVVDGLRITYTPKPGYSGETDTFTYTATNGVSTGTGTISVSVRTVEESTPYAAGPSGTKDLYGTLRDAMDNHTLEHGIYTQHVLVKGRETLIVYIAGTMEGWLTGDQSRIRNLPSAHGIVDESQVNVIKAAMRDADQPILLVGFSQGGMDAQNIAARAATYGLKDQIKAVITYGSPLVRTDHYPTVHLQDPADPIPKITVLFGLNRIANVVNLFANRSVYLAASRNTTNLATYSDFFGTWGVHGIRETYEDIGQRFDADTSSHWNSLRNALSAFLDGQIVPDGYKVDNGEIVPNVVVEF